ncbi:MAG: hypothetical protein ACI8PZ_004218 [Myxococcota bacterium]|jgi:hypothetical protein
MRPILLGILLITSISACKRTPTEVRGRAGMGDDLPAPSIESGLHVVVISPSRVAPNTPTAASVVGAGFMPGATVRIGAYAIPGVARVDENTLRLTLPGLPLGTYDVAVTNPDGRSATLRSGLTVGGVVASATCPSVVVHFDLDKSMLRPADRASLDAAMPCWRSATAPVRVEGHADERGTTDYNLVLGQRRADSVRMHVAAGGVPGSRITTVSYGEERPVARGAGEGVWSQNRRAEVSLVR